MQREILLTGIGGQGVQLTAKTLATAAVRRGRHVMLLGRYAGAMRGGQTDASVVIGDQRLRSLPIVQSAWAAVAMHRDYWPSTSEKLRAGGVVVANSSLVEVDRPDCSVFDVPATQIATDLGAPLTAGFVIIAALASITSLVERDDLVDAMRELVPPYRSQHLEANVAAIDAGYEFSAVADVTAWPELATNGVS